MSSWFATIWRFLISPALQVTALTVVQIAGFMAAVQVAGFSQPTRSESQRQRAEHERQIEEPASNSSEQSVTTRRGNQLKMFLALVIACFMNSASLLFWLRKTHLGGFRLMAGTFMAFFLCMTMMPQSDTYFFVRSAGQIIRSSLVLGLVVSSAVAIASVFVLGRLRGGSRRYVLGLSYSAMIIRVALCVIVYAVIYVAFGYFVAWKNPELRMLYGGSDQLLGFWDRITTPPVPNRVIPFQLLRGFVWTLICLFMLRVSSGTRMRSVLSVSAFIAVVMNSQLLLPNPLMSEQVRHIHLLETASSNFVFGIFCTLLWTTHQTELASTGTMHPESDTD